MMTKGATQFRWNTLLQACLITTENMTLACRPISITGYIPIRDKMMWLKLTVFVSCICNRQHQSETRWQSGWVQWPQSSTAPAHSWDCLRGRHSGSCPGRCSRQMGGHRGHWGTRWRPQYSTCPGNLPYIHSDSTHQSCGSGVCPHKEKFHGLQAEQYHNSYCFLFLWSQWWCKINDNSNAMMEVFINL